MLAVAEMRGETGPLRYIITHGLNWLLPLVLFLNSRAMWIAIEMMSHTYRRSEVLRRRRECSSQS